MHGGTEMEITKLKNLEIDARKIKKIAAIDGEEK